MKCFNLNMETFQKPFAKPFEKSAQQNSRKKIYFFLLGAFFKELDISYATGPRYPLQLDEWVG